MYKANISLFIGIKGYIPYSMLRYNTCVLNYLQTKSTQYNIKLYEGNYIDTPLLKGLVNRYIIYFIKKCRNAYSKYNHILDHANAGLSLLFPKDSLVLTTFHDLAFKQFDHTNYFIDKIISSGLKRANIIVSDSNYIKSELMKSFNIQPEKIKVVYIGIDRNKFKKQNKLYSRKSLSLPKDKVILLHVGSETNRKNIPTLIETFHKFHQKYSNTILIRVGQMKPQTQQLIKKLGIEKHILYLSNITDETLSLIYNAADIFVFPSIYEGFGLPVIEAMACGLPVITSNTTSLPEVVGNAGITINPSSQEEIYSAIETLYYNSEYKITLTKRGLIQAQKFNLKQMGQKIEEAYNFCFKN